MKRYAIIAVALVVAFCAGVSAQVPMSLKIQIAQAEDARRYNAVLENLMASPNADVRERAALAAGRIGDDLAVPALVGLLEKDSSYHVREMAAFSLGEIESAKAAAGVESMLRRYLTTNMDEPLELTNRGRLGTVQGRLVEAAGKIAGANASDPNAKRLGKAILDMLEAHHQISNGQDRYVIQFALTAALRARPENADTTVAKFLTNTDARVRADAANTLARLRAKNANDALRAMLKDADAIARATAARALGAAEDKGAVDVLMTAATGDADSRVRVSAIRALAALRDAKTGPKLIERGEALLNEYKKSKHGSPIEKNELLEIAITMGRNLQNSKDEKAVSFLDKTIVADRLRASEFPIARLRISQITFHGSGAARTQPEETNWHVSYTLFQMLREVVALSDTEETRTIKSEAKSLLKESIDSIWPINDPPDLRDVSLVGPEALRGYAAFKPDDLGPTLLKALTHNDVFIRSTAADLLGDQPKSKENVDALKTAFTNALLTDKAYNDAQFSILDALFKLDKKESVGMLLVALNAKDYLLRQKAFQMLGDKDLQKDFPGIATSLENAKKAGKDKVLPYNAAFGTKLGQVLNTRADYGRALARKNGSVKAVLTTEKGAFTIDFYPEEAPLTVDNFIKLARSGYFNGVEVHRVVPNFVMQDGDRRGDGNGGPGWSIRCEVNMLMYERGMVGMALSGKDTGGSQWFVTHSPQPHLDGGYTIFGRVNEKDMKVVDNIVRGDKILTVKIVGR